MSENKYPLNKIIDLVSFLSFKCPVEGCDETLQSIKEVHSHLLFVHNKFEPECPVCKEKFTSFGRLRIHEKSHGGFDFFLDQFFSQTFNFNNCHNSNKEYSCNICGQKFSQKHYLKSHMQKHDTGREKYNCSLCTRAFLYKGNLSVHIK